MSCSRAPIVPGSWFRTRPEDGTIEEASLFEDMPITLGRVHGYAFHFAKTAGAEIEVSGMFDGRGQRPSDVNEFFSYS